MNPHTASLDESVEHWQEIPGLAGYQASTLGRVRSTGSKWVAGRPPVVVTRKGRVLKERTNGRGYKCVSLRDKTRLVHRLVCTAFHGASRDGHVVNHKNGIKCDNRPVNIEWVSQKQNIEHAVATGLRVINSNASLSPDEVYSIVASHKDGARTRDLAMEYEVDITTIQRIIGGRSWKNRAAALAWKRVKEGA